LNPLFEEAKRTDSADREPSNERLEVGGVVDKDVEVSRGCLVVVEVPAASGVTSPEAITLQVAVAAGGLLPTLRADTDTHRDGACGGGGKGLRIHHGGIPGASHFARIAERF
jgi:hypothetical protein